MRTKKVTLQTWRVVRLTSSNIFLEFLELEHLLQPEFEVYRYTPDEETFLKHQAGGVAIIDQIICSYARFFIGTHESTFSFRIQEEREIMGFPAKTTFNRLCGDNVNYPCEKPSVWKIVYWSYIEVNINLESGSWEVISFYFCPTIESFSHRNCLYSVSMQIDTYN